MIRIFFIMATLLAYLPHAFAALSVKCKINHELHHDNHVIFATYGVNLNKNHNGVIAIFGKYSDGTNTAIINRQILFTYTSSDNDDENIILTSTGINHYSSESIDGEAFKSHYPAFFSVVGKQLSLTIQPFSPGVLMMSFMSAPLFICA